MSCEEMVVRAVYAEDGSIVGYVGQGEMFTCIKVSDDVWDLVIEPSEDLSPENFSEECLCTTLEKP